MAWETLLSLGHEVEFVWAYVSVVRVSRPSVTPTRMPSRARPTSLTKFPFLILRWYSICVLLYVVTETASYCLRLRLSELQHHPSLRHWSRL
jgi:hypothetical protein